MMAKRFGGIVFLCFVTAALFYLLYLVSRGQPF
jgi:hypothetical protein